MNRPEFDDIKDYEEFSKYYWYRDELIKICKAHGLKAPSGKIELNKVIEAYFSGEKILPDRKGKSRKKKTVVTDLTLQTGLIECGFTFGNRFREFFKLQTGKENFKFSVDMVATVKEVKKNDDESFTLGDLLDIYYGKKTYAVYDKSALQWNRFVKNFCEDKATTIFGDRLKAAAALWKIVRESDMKKEYSHDLFEKYKDDIGQVKRVSIMKIGICACSNGQKKEWKTQNDELISALKRFDIEPVLSSHIYAVTDEFSGTDEERAADLMEFYRDSSIDAIFDISGGDLSNGILKYLDFDIIAGSRKSIWGYSDLTTVINAIYTLTGKPSVLWQIKNLVYSEAALQRARFREYLCGDENQLFRIEYRFLQGKRMAGTLVGGNLRCLLKLVGTRYWPDMHGKILLMESLGGESGQIAAMFAQLEQMGVFDQINGVLLGTFMNFENAHLELTVYDLLKMHINTSLPVAATKEIGHGHDSKAIVIGKELVLE